MFAEIPLAGNCEIKELKCDFFTDPDVPLEDDFTVIKKDNSSFCCCDPDVTIALCKHLVLPKVNLDFFIKANKVV